jgi:hypothetical protein
MRPTQTTERPCFQGPFLEPTPGLEPGTPFITSNGEAGVIRRESAFRAGIAAQANIPDARRRRAILDTRLDTPLGGCEEEAAGEKGLAECASAAGAP